MKMREMGPRSPGPSAVVICPIYHAHAMPGHDLAALQETDRRVAAADRRDEENGWRTVSRPC
jgi:hypothetical protein